MAIEDLFEMHPHEVKLLKNRQFKEWLERETENLEKAEIEEFTDRVIDFLKPISEQITSKWIKMLRY